MSKRGFVFLSLGVSVVGLLLILQVWGIPHLLRSQLTKQVESNCTVCKLTLGEIHFSFIPSTIVLNDIHLMHIQEGLNIDARMSQIKVKLLPLFLFARELAIEEIQVEKPIVIIDEGDVKGFVPPSPTSDSQWTFKIEKTLLVNGKFTYRHERYNKTASVLISDINAQVDLMGSTAELREKEVHGHATTLIGESGRGDLTVNAFLFSKEWNVDITLDLVDQNLADLNTFFIPNDEIKVQGMLSKGQNKISIRGDSLSSSVSAEYEHLDVDMKGGAQRSETGAFLSNLMSAFKIDAGNANRKKGDQIRSIHAKLQDGEPFMGFIFRGMKEAAMKVATD